MELKPLEKIIKFHKTPDPVSFDKIREQINRDPLNILRDIHVVFPQMFFDWVGEGYDEYPEDPESVGYVKYDFGKICEDGCENPFFADRPTQNRLMNHLRAISTGKKRKKFTIIDGMSGTGKSVLVDNIAQKFEEYTKTSRGFMPEVVWRLDVKKILGRQDEPEDINLSRPENLIRFMRDNQIVLDKDHYDIVCPSHDHPITLIPRESRRDFLEATIGDDDLVQKLSRDHKYKWIFYEKACGVCQSIYQELADRFDTPVDVFKMVYARPMVFNRTLGRGIGVFMPGNAFVEKPNNVDYTQKILDRLFGENRVKYAFSIFSKLNNGVVILEDLKEENLKLIKMMHGLISEGIWQVPGTDVKESHKSVKIVVKNPDDFGKLDPELKKSLMDRGDIVKIKGILDYTTEVRFYQDYNDMIEDKFMPGVLENFAKVIVATRLDEDSKAVRSWLGSDLSRPKQELHGRSYLDYIDDSGYMIRMLVWAGIIPEMIVPEDKEKFKAKQRLELIAEAETQHDKGLSGRDVTDILDEFINAVETESCKRQDCKGYFDQRAITNDQMLTFFRKKFGLLQKDRSAEKEGSLDLNYAQMFKVIDAIQRYYRWEIEEQIKTALSVYSDKMIETEILEYIFCSIRDEGTEDFCSWTSRNVKVSNDFMDDMESVFLGPGSERSKRLKYRRDQLTKFNQDLSVKGKNHVKDSILTTDQYIDMHELYKKNKKHNSLEPIQKNWSIYKNAILAYGSKEFETSYDNKVKNNVLNLIKNMDAKDSVSRYDLSKVKRVVIDYFDGKLDPKR